MPSNQRIKATKETSTLHAVPVVTVLYFIIVLRLTLPQFLYLIDTRGIIDWTVERKDGGRVDGGR